MTLAIRPYRADADLEPCLAIWRAASEAGHPFLGAGALDDDEPLVRDVYMPAAEVWVADAGGPVGFIALLDGFVGGLFVAPGRHGEGIGRALVEHAAALRGALTVDVYEENVAAQRFYRRAGFVETGRRAEDDRGRPHALVSMRRTAVAAS